MGTVSNRTPRFLASATESLTLPADEYAEGMVTPTTFSGPRALAASAQTTAESMPPDSPTATLSKPHLAA